MLEPQRWLQLKSGADDSASIPLASPAQKLPLGKVSAEEATSEAAQVAYLSMRLKQRLLERPPGIDIVEFVQFDGKPPADLQEAPAELRSGLKMTTSTSPLGSCVTSNRSNVCARRATRPARPTVMTSRSTLRMLLVTASLFGMASPLWGDDPKDEKTRAVEFHAIAKRSAAAYNNRHLGSDRPLTLKPEPILKWSNPVKGSTYGDVFIWTENGRPEAVASIYKWYSPHTHRANEFHSLALDKRIGERDGVPVWTSSRPGPELKPIPAAPVPADSAAAGSARCARLVQEFTGHQTSRQRMKRDMRLLTEPVFRDENTKGDGPRRAIFQQTKADRWDEAIANAEVRGGPATG